MHQVLQFPKSKREPNEQVVKRCRELLEKALEGDLTSLAYMSGHADGAHKYDMVGEYTEHPERVFVPATKAMFALCIHINDKGRKV